jgi:predicted nucleic acid-binding protein
MSLRHRLLKHGGVVAVDYAARFNCAFYDALYLVMAHTFECHFVHADHRLHNTLAGRFPREAWIEAYETS